MNTQAILERTIRARNSIGTLTATGVENMRRVVNVYDYMTETAQMLAKAQQEEQAKKEEKTVDPDKD